MPRWKRQAYKPGGGSQPYHTLCSSRDGGLTHWGFSQAVPLGHLPTSYLSLGNQLPRANPKPSILAVENNPSQETAAEKAVCLGHGPPGLS